MAENQAQNGGAQQDGGQQEQKQVNGGGEGNKEDRKLFVGGLSSETSQEQLKEHFGKYGDIVNVDVKVDPNTGRSRGFAFILFSSADSISKVLAAGDHIINNKRVDPKKAKARVGKVFVGGLVPEISDEEIKTFFSQYGAIVEVELPFDKVKKQRRGFCFITFESEQVANELLKRPKQTINGKQVDVKRVTVKPDSMGGGGGGGMSGGRGRGRGGRGGYQAQYGSYGAYDPAAYRAYGRYDGYDSGYGDYSAYDYGSGYGSYDGGYSGGKQMGRGRQAPRQQPY